MGPVTPTNGPISEMQHGGCAVASLEKVKHIAKTKYIETVCIHYWVCLKLKIQTESFTLADNFGCAFFASLVSMFFQIGTCAWTLHRGTHTQHSWQPCRHWVTWYTYNSIVIFTLLRRWFQDCSRDSVSCQWVWNKCDYFIKLLF